MNAKTQFGLVAVTVAFSINVQGQSGNPAPIPGLYNTGVNASGVSLPGGSQDPHWTLSGGVTGVPYVLSQANIAGVWTPDTTYASWIGVYDSQNQPTSDPYYFNETFSLAGFDYTTATLSGNWSGDDGTSIEINGHVIANGGDNNNTPWSVNGSSGWFNPGSNTLSVEMVSSDGTFDGCQVVVSGTAVPGNTSPPIITNQTQAAFALVGGTASFAVGVSGGAPFNFQWQFDGTNLSDGSNTTGSSTATLTLENLNTNQAGSYQVVVSNGFGSVTSTPAVLNVAFIWFSIDGQIATNSFSVVGSGVVTISGGYSNGFIFYTTDGSTPSESSPLYAGPFTLTNSAVLQAISLSEDFSQTAQSSPVTLEIIPGYNLQTSVIGSGTISLNPANGPYASNSVVALTANAMTNWAFDHWTGAVTGSQNPTSVTMTGPLSVQAVFVPTAYNKQRNRRREHGQHRVPFRCVRDKWVALGFERRWHT